MAEDIFLKLDGIDGESSQKSFKDWIEISSFSWGATNPVTPGARPGQATPDDILVSKTIDKSSAPILGACLAGKEIPTAQFTFMKSKSDKSAAMVEFLKISLTTVFVSSYDVGDPSGGSLPTDRVSFSFEKIVYEYFPLNGPGITTVWSPPKG